MVQETLKDSKQESNLVNIRLWLSMGGFVIIVFFLVYRMHYLQVVNFKTLTTQSNENRIFVQPVPPTRGLIYDSKGQLIAKNIPSFTLSIIPERVRVLKDTLAHIQQIVDISPDNLKDFRHLLKQRHPFEAIPLKFRLTSTEIARISVDQYKLPGVEIQAQLIRCYPDKNLYADIIGYVGRINDREQKNLDLNLYSGTHTIGKTGLERYYEAKLLGIPGYHEAEVDVRGRIKRILKETLSTPGKNLHLYINPDVQKAAVDAMKDQRGAVVAIDPKTGGILAMVSAPSFDPNLFVTGISYKAYNELNQDKGRPLFNRAVLGEYPPASTIKPIMALAGLDQKLITTGWKIYDKGYYQLPGFKHKYRNWKRSGHGWVDMHKAIVQSNDTYFYQVAVKLGIDNIYKYSTQFGLGVRPALDFPALRAGLIPSPQWKKRTHNQPWYPGETVISGIGQGYMQTTPLQLAIAAANLANRGHVITPQLVRADPVVTQTRPGPVTLTSSNTSEKSKDAMNINSSENNWQAVITAMRDVIVSPYGTGYRGMGIKKPSFTVAGKTGTAQVISIPQGEHYDPEKLQNHELDHGLFIGFAPVRNPGIAIAVVVENKDKLAVPIARKVLESYFKSTAIKKTSKITSNKASASLSLIKPVQELP